VARLVREQDREQREREDRTVEEEPRVREGVSGDRRQLLKELERDEEDVVERRRGRGDERLRRVGQPREREHRARPRRRQQRQ
jgi:hypothetical protein